MKILFASSSSGSRGGGEFYLVYLGRALAKRGHDVRLWVSSHQRMDELCGAFAEIGPVVRAEYRNMYDRRTRSIGSHFDRRTARRAADEWRALGPDIVHINKQNLEDALDLLRAANLSQLPSVCTIHLTQTARYLGAVLAFVRDFVARRALERYGGEFVCVLDERERDLRRFLGARARIHTIPNGVELYDLTRLTSVRESKRADLGIDSNTLLILAVGRLVPQKRPLVFLELAQRIHSRLPKTQFLWVGDGALASDWDAAVAQNSLAPFVRRVGWQQNVRDYLFAADVFLHTAEFEGLPLAILEALSAGLPCAITPNLLAEMPFLNGDNSIAIDADDRWVDTFSNPTRLAGLGKNSRQLAEEKFSFDLMAERFEALYSQVRNRR